MMKTWILGLAGCLLVACGVESVSAPPAPVPSDDVTSVSEAALASESATPDLAQPAAVCTPGQNRLCCPFPQGCSCQGDQTCDASGNWGACEGAGLKGHLCP